METPMKYKFAVVPGSILIHKKWNDTALANNLKARFNYTHYRDIGPYDFCLSGDKFIIYVPESALVTHINPEKYLELIKHEDTVIIAIRSTITAEQYSHLQDILVINGNKKLIPIGDASEIPELLSQMSFLENTPKKLSKSQSTLNQLNILLNIPGLGKLKAEKLLETFGTISRIASSSVSELSSTVGLNVAAEVYKYFH